MNIRDALSGALGRYGRDGRRIYRTMAGRMRVYEAVHDDDKPIRVMNVRGTYQSATYLDDECYELVFAYHRAYNAMFEAQKAGFSIRRVAMLGGGGFSYPKYLIAHYPDIAVDVVEIDPMVVSIAERWFYVDRLRAEFEDGQDERLGIFVDDARAFLEEPGDAYDVILNDCFTGRIPTMSLATAEAAQEIHRRLQPGGLYLANVISALRGDGSSLLHRVMFTLQREFTHVHVIAGCELLPRRVDNYIVIATDGDYAFPHTIGVEPDPGTRLLVDACIDDYEREFYLMDM